jgi:hypothetical protein
MTNVTADHRAAFEALVSDDYANFALFSCFVNDEPAAAIVAVNRDGDDYITTRLFEPPPNWWTPLVSSGRSGKVSNGPGTASLYG